jgi:hypothetical protein
MTPTYVPLAIRRQVIDRARRRCEYCLYPQDMSFLSFQIEHIVAEKHGGQTTLDNLALSCPFCNRFKGSDLGSLDPETGQLTPFFHPRRQTWKHHFRLQGALIVPQSPEGRVTVVILRLNLPERIQERERLIEIARYP